MPRNVLDVDVFTDGKGPLLGNSHCAEFHSESDSGFDHVWADINPPYTNDMILKTVQKILCDFARTRSTHITYWCFQTKEMPFGIRFSPTLRSFSFLHRVRWFTLALPKALMIRTIWNRLERKVGRIVL